MIRNASKRLNDIANNMLSQSNKKPHDSNNTVEEEAAASPELIFVVLDSIITEKRYEYDKNQININLNLPDSAYNCFANINISSFKRVLSNLINNSIEAILSNGSVIISMKCDINHVEISIEDNGVGIPPDILTKVTTQGFSFNKKTGTGFGLSHAKQYIEHINGTLHIQSNINLGTKVIIKLPRSSYPSWFCGALKIKGNFVIIALDDDPSIHDTWNERFSKISDISITHFTRASDLTKNKIDKLEANLYLIDYELINCNKNGLDIIEELNLNNKSILVTSCFENISVRNRAETLGVKILPKSYVPYIPINQITEESDNTLIFIDNDENIRIAWALAAAKSGKKLFTFASSAEFEKEINNFNKNINIYIDSDLGNNIKGEIYAEKLYNLGFNKVYLSTGYPANQFKYMPWIASIIGKEPPF